ncbi:conserved hypothetical protein, membrane [Candidatus Magnetomorum sp. HK-1]|nr:conserved hypothetical protein, membrane [Candidatus Magnetomorum sp. HK-1]
MKKYLIIVGFVLISLNLPCAYAEKETVNERLIRIEETIKNLDMRLNQRIDDTNRQIDLLRQGINRRIDDVNKRLDDSRSYDLAIIVAILSLMAMILWDRRTSLKPINDQIRELKERLDYMWEHFKLDKKVSVITP